MIVNQISEEEIIRREEERKKNIEYSKKCQREECRQIIKGFLIGATVIFVLFLAVNNKLLGDILKNIYIIGIIISAFYLGIIIIGIIAARIRYLITGKNWNDDGHSHTTWMDRP